MNKENCALKLVDEIILKYGGLSLLRPIFGGDYSLLSWPTSLVLLWKLQAITVSK